jgi:hypothetical protein
LYAPQAEPVSAARPYQTAAEAGYFRAQYNFAAPADLQAAADHVHRLAVPLRRRALEPDARRGAVAGVQPQLAQPRLGLGEPVAGGALDPGRRGRRIAGQHGAQLRLAHPAEPPHPLIMRLGLGRLRRAARHQKLARTVNFTVRPAPGITWFSEAEV